MLNKVHFFKFWFTSSIEWNCSVVTGDSIELTHRLSQINYELTGHQWSIYYAQQSSFFQILIYFINWMELQRRNGRFDWINSSIVSNQLWISLICINKCPVILPIGVNEWIKSLINKSWIYKSFTQRCHDYKTQRGPNVIISLFKIMNLT